ncbi:hypothetical protein JW707_01925 [Candidatus Woesearchaeota archaeon]|nr:hypothetical protein [Candidatus Woesearchaeota archaeon]
MKRTITERIEEAEKAGVPAEVLARSNDNWITDIVINLFQKYQTKRGELAEIFKYAKPREYHWICCVVGNPNQAMPILGAGRIHRQPTLNEAINYADRNYSIALPNLAFPGMKKEAAERKMDEINEQLETLPYSARIRYMQELAEEQGVKYVVVKTKIRAAKNFGAGANENEQNSAYNCCTD